jgi:hypothetical protein
MIRRRQLSARLNLQPQKKEPTRLTDVVERIVLGSLAGNEAIGRVAVPQALVGVDPCGGQGCAPYPGCQERESARNRRQ